MPDTYHQLDSLGKCVSSSSHQEMWSCLISLRRTHRGGKSSKHSEAQVTLWVRIVGEPLPTSDKWRIDGGLPKFHLPYFISLPWPPTQLSYFIGDSEYWASCSVTGLCDTRSNGAYRVCVKWRCSIKLLSISRERILEKRLFTGFIET